MQVIKLEEHGYTSALYGFSLSYKDRAIPREDWWPICHLEDGCPDHKDCADCNEAARRNQIQKTATANAGRGKGHDKWLRQVQVWLDIEAPRYWWSEFDTYKVGTVAQSESTMHTLNRRDVTLADFENGDEIPLGMIEYFNFKRQKITTNTQTLKGCLPESYLQRRVVTLNYAVLRCIIEQRKNHRLPEWHQFIESVYDQMDYPELLPKREDKE